MAKALVEGREIDGGAAPPDLLDKQWSLLPPVLLDALPPGTGFVRLVSVDLCLVVHGCAW